MKKIQFLLLMVAVAIMPAVMASCEKDEPTNVNPPSNTDPEEDKFEDLYGYWINWDNTGAMEFTKSGSDCNVRYYAHTTDGLESFSSTLYHYSGTSGTFIAYTSEGVAIVVRIISNTKNRIVLEKQSGYSWENLSSYSFSRTTEKAFYDFLEGGKDEPNDPEESDDAAKLIGSWKYNDYGDEFILTFYSNGNAREECYMDGDFTYSENGTYKYSNGKITEWSIIDEGSAFAQTFSDVPWTVKFISSTKMTLTGSGKYADTITLTKQ